MDLVIKSRFRDLLDDYDAMLNEAAELIKKADVSVKDKDLLYSALGHMAANWSVFSEIVKKVTEKE